MRRSSVPLAVLLAVLGCWRGAAHPPAQPPTSTPSTSAPSGAPAPAPDGSNRVDPSEEITEAELTSIPEPVEVSDAAPPAAVPPPSPESPPASQGNGSIWRVQIFASQDLAQADRVAKEASARFGEPARIEFEGTLYKVRLGAFSSEALAQALREKAVSGGFPGAFRMRSSEAASDENR